jgi:hypothetical protein
LAMDLVGIHEPVAHRDRLENPRYRGRCHSAAYMSSISRGPTCKSLIRFQWLVPSSVRL